MAHRRFGGGFKNAPGPTCKGGDQPLHEASTQLGTAAPHVLLGMCFFQVGGWFPNPFEKYVSQNGSIFPKFRGEDKRSLKFHHLVFGGGVVFWNHFQAPLHPFLIEVWNLIGVRRVGEGGCNLWIFVSENHWDVLGKLGVALQNPFLPNSTSCWVFFRLILESECLGLGGSKSFMSQHFWSASIF